MTLETLSSEIKNILQGKVLPSHDYLFDIADKVSAILEEEKTEYRPVAGDGSAGSLLDFSSSDIPVIIVPDIHARPFFLLNILEYKLPAIGGKSVLEALYNKEVRLVCVGDILHSERNTKARWQAAMAEFVEDVYTGPSMSAEMLDGLSVLSGFLLLKMNFPEYVHILKGNHENIYNSTGNGDYSFRKYADEGHMVKHFMQEFYGDDILYMIHCVERALPLVFVGKKCVISHAEPIKAYTKQQLIDARLEKGIVEGLTWTDNNEAEEGSVSTIISNLTEENDVVYFGGHRPVVNNYEYRQNKTFIQIHNPSQQNISFVDNKKLFNPETDIYEVSK